MFIDTARVSDRRSLRFASPAEALADAQRIAASDRAGTLRRSGNWTAGQCLSHIAAWIDYPFDGFPAELEVSPADAAESLAMLPSILTGAMPAGIVTPGAERRGGAFGAINISADVALARVRSAWHRIAATAPPLPDPFFGQLSHEQWIAINLRHAELHQSFQHPS